MTIDFERWFAQDTAQQARKRAVFAERRIKDKPTEVAFKTAGGTTLAAQTVRVEYDGSSRERVSAAGTQSVRGVIIFGWRDHPYLEDTDIKSGYTFILHNREFQVKDVIYTLGEIQATAEVLG